MREWLGQEPLKLSVEVALKRIGQRAKKTAGDIGLSALALAQTILGTNDPKERTGASLILILWIIQFWKSIEANLSAELRNLHTDGGRQRLSLAILAHDSDAWRSQTIREFQQWLIESCVLSQAIRVAIEKLSRGDFRFFILRDESGFRLVRPRRQRSYLAYDSSRLGSAFSLLLDLSLVDLKNGLRLTEAGRRVLNRVRAFHSRQLRMSPA